MMDEGVGFRRRTAVKISIRDLIHGEFVEGVASRSYVRTAKGDVACVNVIGFVVQCSRAGSSTSFVLDDGTGAVPAQCFEGNTEIGVGDVVLVVGQPRQFQDSVHLVADVVKQLNGREWLALRRKELRKGNVVNGQHHSNSVNGDSISSLIRELDTGPGVDVEEIALKLQVSDVDSVIGPLLKKGVVFEVTPGKVKVLE